MVFHSERSAPGVSLERFESILGRHTGGFSTSRYLIDLIKGISIGSSVLAPLDSDPPWARTLYPASIPTMRANFRGGRPYTHGGQTATSQVGVKQPAR